MTNQDSSTILQNSAHEPTNKIDNEVLTDNPILTLMPSKKDFAIAEIDQSDVPRFGRRGLRSPIWNERMFPVHDL